MRRIRILIVDDAVVVRRLLAGAFANEADMEVAGTAPSGRIALEKIARLDPDVVILDVEMPDMDGLETLAAIRRTLPDLPVIMFSTLTRRGAAATMDALFLGASDYVAKPSKTSDPAAALECVTKALIPRIRTLSNRTFRAGPPGGQAPPSSAGCPIVARRRVDVVAIGVSTGGPVALGEILTALPATFPVPILIVQHMPPVFTRLLAERLSSRSALEVREGADGDLLLPGRAFVAPGSMHMGVARTGAEVTLRLVADPPENSCRPAVDVLFRSVAQVYEGGALGLVLTGMGQDGLNGCMALREARGRVLVQDEATSIVWGMPGYVARAGLADAVLPLDRIGAELIRIVAEGRSTDAASLERMLTGAGMKGSMP